MSTERKLSLHHQIFICNKINFKKREKMKYKKFLLIPILFVAYIFFINLLTEATTIVPAEVKEGQQPSGSVQQIGVAATASVSVTRPYFFGLIELPVYTNALGDISYLHNIFFLFLLALTVIFIIIEWRKRHE
jgi:hypothetical protein